jgi:hypothetical protein
MQACRKLPMFTALCIGVFATVLHAADLAPVQQEVRLSSSLGAIKLFKASSFGTSTGNGIRISVPPELLFTFGKSAGTAFQAPIPGLHVALPTMASGWRAAHIPQTEASNPFARTLHSISQFYGHSPSSAQNGIMRREEMRGRSVHLHMRF